MLKQMRLIHTKGFTVQERKQWRVTIFGNLLHAFQCIQGAMEEHDVEYADPGNIKYMEMICSDPEIGIEDALPLNCMAAFKCLWADQGVQTAIAKGHEYALHDNLE